MKIVWTILFGFLAGVAGGMGLGGGTVLIPLLQSLDYSQAAIQAMNLLSFIPMATVALHFHFKNRLVQTKGVFWVVVPAVLFCILGAVLAADAGAETLKICFGAFLTVIGVWEIYKSIKDAKKTQKEKEKEKLEIESELE